MRKAAIIMGSDSDLPTLTPCVEQLRALRIPFEAHVFSAHRTPDEAAAFATEARRNGFGVLIAAAGKAAHLAGALAARTTLPVIGVPVDSGGLGGLDALLSTVQMPPGVPVATVAINGARNAAILAAKILRVSGAVGLGATGVDAASPSGAASQMGAASEANAAPEGGAR